MTDHTSQGRPGPDPVQRDARPEEEPSEAEVEQMVTEFRANIGRPSLTGSGVSPTMNVRLPQEMRERLDRLAAKQGRRPSEVARDALEEYLASH